MVGSLKGSYDGLQIYLLTSLVYILLWIKIHDMHLARTLLERQKRYPYSQSFLIPKLWIYLLITTIRKMLLYIHIQASIPLLSSRSSSKPSWRLTVTESNRPSNSLLRIQRPERSLGLAPWYRRVYTQNASRVSLVWQSNKPCSFLNYTRTSTKTTKQWRHNLGDQQYWQCQGTPARLDIAEVC